jgi:hypothetical protein
MDWVVLDGFADAGLTGADWEALLETKSVLRFAAAGGGAAASDELRVLAHPLTKYLSMADVHIGAVDAGMRVTGGQALIMAGEQGLVYASETGVRRQVTFAFNLQDSDLTLRAEFPVLMLNIAQWLGNQTGTQLGEQVAGERIEVMYDLETVSAAWVPLEQGGRAAVNEAAMPAFTADQMEDGTTGLLHTPATAGLYALQEQNTAGEMIAQRYISVTPAPEELINPAVPALNLNLPNGIDPLEETPTSLSGARAPQSIVRYLVLLLFLLLVLEWRVYQRGL